MLKLNLKILLCAIATIIFTGCAKNNSAHKSILENTSDTNVVELAIYTVKKGHTRNFLEARKKAIEKVKEFKGFGSANGFQSTRHPNLYVDYFIWSTLSDAKEAAEKILNCVECQPFLNSIEEVKLFDHVSVIREWDSKPEPIDSPAGVVELAVYTVRDVEPPALSNSRNEVISLIQGYRGFESMKTHHSFGDRSLFVDLVWWKQVEDGQNADKEVQKTDQGKEYFGFMKEVKFFDYLTPIHK
jgi:heme-degrading monooxygenase HmoA